MQKKKMHFLQKWHFTPGLPNMKRCLVAWGATRTIGPAAARPPAARACRQDVRAAGPPAPRREGVPLGPSIVGRGPRTRSSSPPESSARISRQNLPPESPARISRQNLSSSGQDLAAPRLRVAPAPWALGPPSPPLGPPSRPQALENLLDCLADCKQ